MILIPDSTNTNNTSEDLVFTVPIPMARWQEWVNHAVRSASLEQNMAYILMPLIPGEKASTIILLADGDQDDDQATYIAARFRLLRDMTGRIYVVRGTYDPWTKAQVQYAAMTSNTRNLLEIDHEENPGLG